MKLNGVKLEIPNEETVVLPRANGPDIIFKAKAVLDYSVFDKMCPEPLPTMIKRVGQEGFFPNYEGKDYKAKIEKRFKQRSAWRVIKSLEATSNLQWEKVNLSDPETWTAWTDELKDSGFCEAEIWRIASAVSAANCLNEERVEAARQRFLLGTQGQDLNLSSLMPEPNTTQSGEPASG